MKKMNMTLMGSIIAVSLLTPSFIGSLWAEETGELTIGEALRLAEKNSPSLKAAMSREKEAHEFTREADSGFFPSLGLDAVESGGFPGSSSGFGTTGEDAFPGLVSSPYRKGAAAGAYAKWDVVDLSVWHHSAAARYAYQASQERTKFQTELVDQEALGTYLEGVRLRGEEEAWRKLVDELTSIRDTVKRFVRNGQYSEVQGTLIEDQLADASLRTSDLESRYQAAVQALALLTGTEAKGISCPMPDSLPVDQDPELDSMGKSPLVAQSELEAQSADESAAKYSAQNLPVLEVAGSAGFLSDTRLEQAQDYSFFAGISLPLFEGFRVDAQEKEARSEAQARREESSAEQLSLDQLNVRYAQQIKVSREELQVLDSERPQAAKAVGLAKQRYLAFLGPLSDLQQALKDMVNLELQTAEAKTQLWSAAESRYLLNGGTSDKLK